MSSARPSFDQAARIEMIKKAATAIAAHYTEKELARTGVTIGEAARSVPVLGRIFGSSIKREILPALVAIEAANSFIDVLKALADPVKIPNLLTAIKAVDPTQQDAVYTANDKTQALKALETFHNETAKPEGVFAKIIHALHSLLDPNKDAAAIAQLIRGLIFSDATAEAAAKAKAAETADEKITHAYLQLLSDLDGLAKQLAADVAPAPAAADMKNDAPAATAAPKPEAPAAAADANPVTTVVLAATPAEPVTPPPTPAAGASKQAKVAMAEALVDGMINTALSTAAKNVAAAKAPSGITLSVDAGTQTEASETKMTAASAAQIGRGPADQAMALAAANLDIELLKAKLLHAEVAEQKQVAELKTLHAELATLRAQDKKHVETETRMGRVASTLSSDKGMLAFELSSLKKQQKALVDRHTAELQRQQAAHEALYTKAMTDAAAREKQIDLLVKQAGEDDKNNRAQIAGLADEHKQRMAAQKATLEAVHNEQLTRLNKTLADVTKQLAAQRSASAAQLAKLVTRVHELESRLADHTDSSESDNDSTIGLAGSATASSPSARASAVIGLHGTRQHLQAANAAASGGAGPNADADATAGSSLQAKKKA